VILYALVLTGVLSVMYDRLAPLSDLFLVPGNLLAS
jgi:hypothetical protein